MVCTFHVENFVLGNANKMSINNINVGKKRFAPLQCIYSQNLRMHSVAGWPGTNPDAPGEELSQWVDRLKPRCPLMKSVGKLKIGAR